MTVEEKLQMMLGAKDFQLAALAVQLETALQKIEELEKSPPDRVVKMDKHRTQT